LTLDDTADFADSGSVIVGVDTITYTGKTSTQLTGIPASGDGSITFAHPVGTEVWQGTSKGLPTYYSVFNGVLTFDRPFSSTYAGMRIKIKLFKKLDRLTSVNSLIEVPFYHIFPYYLTYRINKLKRNVQAAQENRELFIEQLKQNALSDMSHTVDTYSYHNFGEPQLEYLTYSPEDED
jgi:hypothetical protein